MAAAGAARPGAAAGTVTPKVARRALALSAVASALVHGLVAALVLSLAVNRLAVPPPMMVELVMSPAMHGTADAPAPQSPQGAGKEEEMPPVESDVPPPPPDPPVSEPAQAPPQLEPVAVADGEPAPVFVPPPPRRAPPRRTAPVHDQARPTERRPPRPPSVMAADRPGANPAEASEGAPAATVPADITPNDPDAAAKAKAMTKAPDPSAVSLAGYRLEILRRLAAAKRYPADALTRGEQGRAVVRIVLDRKGTVVRWTLVEGTGSPRLDREVAALVARAAPYPELPPGLPHETIEILAPLEFAVR